MAMLTATDELDLSSMGEKKVALFALIPDNDTSFNFLVSILYTQLFQQLFYTADRKYRGSLPVHVHFCMDEFSNVSLPDDFDQDPVGDEIKGRVCEHHTAEHGAAQSVVRKTVGEHRGKLR